jgi:hypothetical protein
MENRRYIATTSVPMMTPSQSEALAPKRRQIICPLKGLFRVMARFASMMSSAPDISVRKLNTQRGKDGRFLKG